MVWTWLRRHPHVADALPVFALAVLYLGREANLHRWRFGLAFAALQVAPLLLRRSFPLTILVVVSAATIAEASVHPIIAPVAVAVAVYTVAAHLPRAMSLGASATAAAGVALVALVRDGYHQAIPTGLLFGLAWVVGDNLRTRRAYLSALEERAARLERERETEAARARAEEQARIARDLHDVIAHNVSVMVVQAAAGNDAFDARPQRAKEALQAIEATGRGALTELRRLLSTVRDGEADYAPQPGLERLDELVAQVRSAGLPVAVAIEGAPQPLPAGVDLSAYRIVQEALTNTLKHAHASTAKVAVRYQAGLLAVEVQDDGTGNGKGDGEGRGLVGMRERVAAFGGSLEAGPVAAGGFAVAATFPL